MHGERRFYMDPKGHIVLAKYPGEWEAMPSYIEEPEAAACKWVSIRENNRKNHDLPTVFSILIYTHPETGFPLAICDGSHHTVMRTGSAAAVSAKWLARKNSKVLAIVGAGHMAAGEINVPLSQGVLKESDITGEIGEVIIGKKKGRTSDKEITLFDSTGIALQDSATIPLEYERALAAGVGIEKKMIST